MERLRKNQERKKDRVEKRARKGYHLKRSPGFYSLVKEMGKHLMNSYYDLSCEGAELIPEKGPMFLAMKHVNILDILAVAVCVDRQLNTLQKIELARNPILGYLLEKAGGISIDREHTLSTATKEAMRYTKWLLQSGEALALFPEMTRIVGYTGKLHPDLINHYHKSVEPIPTFCVGIWYSEPERWLKPGNRIEIMIENADMRGETLEEIADSMGRQMARLSRVDYRPKDSPKYLYKNGPMDASIENQLQE